MGLNIDTNLSWQAHIDILGHKLSKAIYAIKAVRCRINLEAAIITYHALFHSSMTYGLINWGNSCYVQKIFLLQKRAIRALSGISQRDTCKPFFIAYKILTLPSAIIYCNLIYIKSNLGKFSTQSEHHDHDTRCKNNLIIPPHRLSLTSKNMLGLRLFNKLPDSLKKTHVNKFKILLKTHLIEKAYYDTTSFSYD